MGIVMDIKDFINFKRYFKQAYLEIADNKFCTDFAKKKFVHSIRVLNTGRELIRQEPILQSLSPATKDFAEKALLFHDVGRFEEICQVYRHEDFKRRDIWFSRKCDHGLLSYQIAGSSPEYNDIRITLPLKHHGHMVEDFYADSQYQNISDASLRREIETILFIVRDADKLANFHIHKYEDNLRRDPFYLCMSDDVRNGAVSAGVMQEFQNHRVIRSALVKSYADRLVMVISWIFDLNFAHSLHLCINEGYLAFLFETLKQYNSDNLLQNQITGVVEKWLAERLS